MGEHFKEVGAAAILPLNPKTGKTCDLCMNFSEKPSTGSSTQSSKVSLLAAFQGLMKE